MASVAAGIALKKILEGLLDKVPQWLASRGQEREIHQIISYFQTDLRYTLSMVDQMQERQGEYFARQQELQWAAFERQQSMFYRAMMTSLQDVVAAAAGSGALSETGHPTLIATITSAHKAMVTSFQQLGQTPLQESAASLAIVARWEMTRAPIFRQCREFRQVNDWTLLAYLHGPQVYYLAVTGGDPASASVRYLPALLNVNPTSDSDWQALVDDGVARFAEFAELPGNGVYDLAARLERYGLRQDFSSSGHDWRV